jgi:hypothetical protein
MKSEGKQGAQNFTKSLFISLLIFSGCLISLMASHARTIFVDVCYGFFLPSKIPCLVCMEILTTSDLWCPILMSRNLCGDVIAYVFIAYHPSGVGGGFFCEIFLHQISWLGPDRCFGEDILLYLSHFVFTKETQTGINEINHMCIFVMICCFQELY